MLVVFPPPVLVLPPPMLVEVLPPPVLVVVFEIIEVVVVIGAPPEQLLWQSRQLSLTSWACTSTILQSPVPLSGWHAEHLSAVTFLPGVPFGWQLLQVLCPDRLCMRRLFVELKSVGWHTTQLLI
jgi:hypothetical protein